MCSGFFYMFEQFRSYFDFAVFDFRFHFIYILLGEFMFHDNFPF